MLKRFMLLTLTLSLVIGCSENNDNNTGPVDTNPSPSQLITDNFSSTSLGEDREVQVYLPQGYDDPENASKTYPLVVFLHGANSSPSTYTVFAQSIIDQAIADSTIHEMIVAFPDGRGGPFDNSFYTNSTVNGNFEDYIVDDVISYMDANYRTIGTPEERAIMGHSMGGYGSMTLALKHKDMFAAVAALSGPIDFAIFPGIVPAVLAENGGQAPYTFTAYDSTFTYLTYSMATAFSPDPSATPIPVDFPIDSDGNLDMTVFALWMHHDPATIAVQNAPYTNLDIYFDCGTEDELGIYPMDVAFDDTLTTHNIPHTFESYSGTHTSGLFTRVPIALAFIDNAFYPAASTMSIAMGR